MTENDSSTLQVPARAISIPAFLSDIARNYLMPQPGPMPYPALGDKAGWRAYVAAVDQAVLPLLQQISAHSKAQVEERDADGARVFDIVPEGLDSSSRGVVLDLHGGALILCGGELCRIMGMSSAARFQQRVWSVDYRMPPDHPYPAPLDDCIAAYPRSRRAGVFACHRGRRPYRLSGRTGGAGDRSRNSPFHPVSFAAPLKSSRGVRVVALLELPVI